MIETASLTTPSPKIQLKSFGCFAYSMILTAATVSELHRIDVIKSIYIISIFMGAGF
jgi:hypothetical protein